MESDLISRGKLMDKIDQWANQVKGGIHPTDRIVWDVLEGVTDTIYDEEAIEAEPKWISVKEKLPEAEGNYLVCSEFADIRNLKIMTFALNLESVDEYCFAGEKRPGWWDFDGETGNYEWSHVTHWMPLPELPKEDGV